MSRSKSMPAYGLHKPSGQARVILGGRHVYLGPHGSAESQERYAQVIAEHFRHEGVNDRTFLPGIRGQPSFAAGLFEKGDAIPVALDGNLRQEQATASMLADEQAVASNLNVFCRDGLRRR